MQLPTLAHRAVDQWLKILRLPVQASLQVLPNGSQGPRNAALLTVDRADATVRATIGSILNDNELVADAQRRRVAAEERERALSLRLTAEAKKAEADDRLAERHEELDQRRADAEQREAAQQD